MDRIYKYNPDATYKRNQGRYLQLISAKDLYIQNITVSEHDSFQAKFPNVFTNYPLGAVRVDYQRFIDWDHYKFTLWQMQLNIYITEVGDKLYPQRSYMKGFALKGIQQRIIKTNNPSTIGPDELLTVHFPDLKENKMIIPRTTKLTFNISLSGTDANRTLVGNLGRNIIRKLVVKLDGNEIISTDDYDILYSYYDCWKSTTERRSAVFQGMVEAGGQTEINKTCY